MRPHGGLSRWVGITSVQVGLIGRVPSHGVIHRWIHGAVFWVTSGGVLVVHVITGSISAIIMTIRRASRRPR